MAVNGVALALLGLLSLLGLLIKNGIVFAEETDLARAEGPPPLREAP